MFEGPEMNQVARLKAIRSAKQIKSALDLFASDFDGAYPNDQNRVQSPLATNSSPSSRTSEFYLNALFEENCLEDEQVFYDKSLEKTFKTKQPDNNSHLEPGENAWAYVKGLSQDSPSHLPLVFTTPIETKPWVYFSKKPHDGRVIVARLDGSTVAEVIAGSGPLTGIVRSKVNGETTDIFAPENLKPGILVPANLTSIKNK